MFFVLLSEIESLPDKIDFTRLYFTYRSMMFRIAMSILHNHADAEDAVAEAFKSIFIHSRKIKDIDCPETKSLLVITVRNKAIDIYRKNKRHITRELTEDIPDLSFKLPEDNGLAYAIATLPAIDRDIVLLRVDNELRFREIAEILNMKTDTVRKRYYRALDKLAASLRIE